MSAGGRVEDRTRCLVRWHGLTRLHATDDRRNDDDWRGSGYPVVESSWKDSCSYTTCLSGASTPLIS